MVEALIIGTILASIGAAAGIYTNQQNIKNNNTRWNQSVELADTAHQREVADLRAAGLNPILSAGGSGSAVPSMTTATAENPGQGFADIASTVANASLTAKMHEGDIAEQKTKKELYGEPQVKKALRDQMLLEGAPTNKYEAYYLAGRKGMQFEEENHAFERIKKLFDDVISTTPNGHDAPNMEPLEKELNHVDPKDPDILRVNKQLEELDRKVEERQKFNPGYWEADENGKFHFVPEKWTKHNNNKKLRRYHA